MARTVAELPTGERITDYISLGVITKTFPMAKIEAILGITGKASQRQRDLPEWVDGETIGRKLGYESPERAVQKLYRRNRDEFKEGETCETKLVSMVYSTKRPGTNLVPGLSPKKVVKPFLREHKVRLFSAHRGALRLCMLSNAPNRAAVHDEILDLFDTYRYGFMLKSIPAKMPVAVTESYIREIKRRMGATKGNRIVKALFDGSFDYGDYIMPIEEIARMPEGTCVAAAVEKEANKKGCHKNTVYRDAARLRDALGIQKIPTKATKEPRKTRSNKGKSLMPEERQKIIDTYNANPGLTKKEIHTLSGTKYSQGHTNLILREISRDNPPVTTARINAWIRELKRTIH